MPEALLTASVGGLATRLNFLHKKVETRARESKNISWSSQSGPLHHLAMASTILFSVLLMAATFTFCSSEPPSRLNLLRFFMGFGPEISAVQKIYFNPEAGLRYREQYEKKYGPRGELLIERLGQGLGTQGPAVVDIDQTLEPSKNKTKHYRTYDFNPPKNRSRSKAKKEVEIKDEENSMNLPKEVILQ